MIITFKINAELTEWPWSYFYILNRNLPRPRTKYFQNHKQPHPRELVSEPRFDLHPSQIQIRVISCCFSVLTFQTVNQDSHFGWYEYFLNTVHFGVLGYKCGIYWDSSVIKRQSNGQKTTEWFPAKADIFHLNYCWCHRTIILCVLCGHKTWSYIM